jgi:hypothetical protein
MSAGINNVVVTIIMVAIAIALVVAIASFVFGLLGNTTKGPNWLLLYESLYNNYTTLKANYTALLHRYEQLRNNYETLLAELSRNNSVYCPPQTSINITYITPTGTSGNYAISGKSGGTESTVGNNATTNQQGFLLLYPNYFVYEVSNLSTYFIIITIRNDLNGTVELYNVTMFINGDGDAVVSNATVNVQYGYNATDDVMITLFPGTKIGEVTSLNDYFNEELLIFNSTIPINVTSIMVTIYYGYGGNITDYEYIVNLDGNT